MLDQCNSMRACSRQYAGLENFAALMNLPRPVTKKKSWQNIGKFLDIQARSKTSLKPLNFISI